MDSLLFSSRSIWTMVHGVFLGGGALAAMAAAVFGILALRTRTPTPATRTQSQYLSWLIVGATVLLWSAVLIGTYVSFPPYRVTPPDALSELSRYPRALLRSDPATAWLHSFGMETKEHLPWLAGMLSAAVAFISVRYRSELLCDRRLRRLAASFLMIAFVVVAAVSFLGILINKVAPLE